VTETIHIAAVLSMIHEREDRNSATRLFRGEPVLAWTLRRLSRASGVGTMTVLCWEDQLEHVEPIAADAGADILVKGPRIDIPHVDAVSAALRWSDGWRGGLLGTCDFDLGFHAGWHHELAQRQCGDALLLVDPASALIDSALVDSLISHAIANPANELCFSPAAPGLSGVLVQASLLERLSTSHAHPGRLLHYLPDDPTRDPIAGEGCAPVPTPGARTSHRFKLDSDRQLRRIAEATIPLNGALIRSEAEELVHRVTTQTPCDAYPREIVLELNTPRMSSPIYWAGARLQVTRPHLTLDLAKKLFDEVAHVDDLRLTLAGVGDPLLSPNFFDIVAAASEAGIHSLHVETDLLGPHADIGRLAGARVDLVSVHLPALTPQTYAAVMGIDGYARVLENIRTFLLERQARRRGVPLIVPVFTKCAANLAEMEPWYDQWLRALGSAVITGPSTCGGIIPDVGVADMAPSRRRPCARLASRMTVLSDGRIVSCEQDVTGRQVMGQVGVDSIAQAWRERFAALRHEDQHGQFTDRPVCAGCKEWHRP
jgi:hypothetical protein